MCQYIPSNCVSHINSIKINLKLEKLECFLHPSACCRPPSVPQVLSVSPEHPAVVLQLQQLQCERLLVEKPGTALPVPVLEQLSAAVMANPTSVSAWHVSHLDSV